MCVRLKVYMNCLISGLHDTNIAWDMVYLVYDLMTDIELNIRDILNFTTRHARV